MLLVLVLLGMLGYYRVPGVSNGNGLTESFQTSVFLELLSFLLTAAFIGPLTAEFVEWRHRREWRPARQTARERLNEALRESIDAYGFFVGAAMHPAQIEPKHTATLAAATLIQKLDAFLDTYDEEHSVFDPGMHSAGSPVRRVLLALRDTMRTAIETAEPNRSVRVQLHRHDLDTLRALFDKPRLGRAAAPTPIERHTFINEDEPIVITADPHFFTTDRLFFDAQVRTFGAMRALRPLAPADFQGLRPLWRDFLADAPSAARPVNALGREDLPTVQAQSDAYVAWLTLFAKDDMLVQQLIKLSQGSAGTATGSA
jgi:hypothetical protein